MTATHPSRARSAVKRTSTKRSALPEREALLNRMEMTDMREHAISCANATQFEAMQNKHMTWNDSGVCNRCVRLLDLFAQRRELNRQFEEDEQKFLVDPQPEIV